VGGYSDWINRQDLKLEKKPKMAETKKSQEKAKANIVDKSKKLSYQEQRELCALPAKIEKLENEINDLEMILASPDFYAKPKEEILANNNKLTDLKNDLQQAYARWEVLDTKA
jgi:ATP-binding cassette subfamily F protein uup